MFQHIANVHIKSIHAVAVASIVSLPPLSVFFWGLESGAQTLDILAILVIVAMYVSVRYQNNSDTTYCYALAFAGLICSGVAVGILVPSAHTGIDFVCEIMAVVFVFMAWEKIGLFEDPLPEIAPDADAEK